MERARILFGCYRRGDANDPEQYVASVAAVLTLYDPDLIREVTDPRTGISTKDKYCDYMPNSGQIKVYCDYIAARRARIAKYASMPEPTRITFENTRPGRRANAFIPHDAPGYQAAMEWIKTADMADWKMDENGRPGVHVNWSGFQGIKP